MNRSGSLKIRTAALVIALSAACVLGGCSFLSGNEEETEDTSETTQEAAVQETTEEETTAAEIENEKVISLYRQYSSEKKFVKEDEVTDAWTDTADLAVFTALVSTADEITYSGMVRAIIDSWNSVETETQYRVGYELSFELDGATIVITILEPEDVENSEYLYNGDYPSSGDYSAITGYMGVWLYDDMAHEGEWYSHVTSSTKTDSTILTSIKLRPTPDSDQISNLVLRGFTYSSEEEFDEDGNYIGTYAYTVTITDSGR